MTLRSSSLTGRRVGVVGAGVIGLSCAAALAMRGATVTLFDRGRAGRAASWAAGGMIAASAEHARATASGATASGAINAAADEAFALARESFTLWPAWAAQLESASGLEVHLRREGTLLPAFTACEAEALRALAEALASSDAPAQWLDADAARHREPALSDAVRGAVYLANDWQVDNRAVVAALAAQAKRLGVSLEEGAEVVEITPGASPHVEVIQDGAAIGRDFDIVLIASGWRAAAFADRFAALRDLHPVKGHMLALAAGAHAPRHVIRAPDVYLIPRRDGRVLVGATEEAGCDDVIDAAVIADLRAAASRVAPALAAASEVERWTGVRPGRRGDPRPLIAMLASGVAAAVGHYRNGILLAPVTASRVCALLEEEAALTPS